MVGNRREVEMVQLLCRLLIKGSVSILWGVSARESNKSGVASKSRDHPENKYVR